jgi:hypothetical protein
MLILGITGFWLIASIDRALAFLGGLIVQYLLVLHAARNYGIELVTNAITAWAFKK